MHAAAAKPGTAQPNSGPPKKPDYAQHTSFAGLDGFSTQQQPMGTKMPGMASGAPMQQAGMGMAPAGPQMGIPPTAPFAGQAMPGLGWPARSGRLA